MSVVTPAPAGWVLGVIIGLVLLGTPSSGAEPAVCGGAVPCRCGDTVSADYALNGDLGPCPGHGLTVRSHVRLDCRGFTIAGLANGSEQFGIDLKGDRGSAATGATIAGCRVTGFLRGIRLRGASGNTILNNVAVGNGNFTKHVGYGIDLAGGSTGNTLHGNSVRGNADEGVHIGLGSHGNRLTDNVLTDNFRENLYLLGANDGVFLRNTVGGTGSNSLYLKDSNGNLFEGNRFVSSPARVVGDSRQNHFVGNTFAESALEFRYYHADPPRRPADNRVTGGSISGKECLRFSSSSGNVVTDTVLGACATQVRSEAPAGTAENTLIGVPVERVVLDEGSTLHQGWRLDVHVRDAGGVPLPGARISLSDGTAAAEALTDDKGDSPTQVVIGSTRTGSRTVSKARHTLTTTKSGYAPDVREVSVTENLKLAIALQPAR